MEYVDKKLLGTLLIVVAVVALIIYAPAIIQWFSVAPVAPPPAAVVKYLYTRGLTAQFRIIDDTSLSLLTANIQPRFYSAGTNPFAPMPTEAPVALATYNSAKGFWEAVLDMGNYVLLVVDTASPATKYPVKVSVSVPGTNETTMAVMLNPALIHMVQRGTVSITSAVYGYNPLTGTYESATKINITKYSAWQLEFRFNVAGVNQIIKGGRIYLPNYEGLTITKAMLDGAPVPVYADADSTDDGMVGRYIVFPDWTAGVHYLVIQLAKTGTPAAGSYTLKLFEYYECLNPTLRWWTDASTTIQVVT